jgi:hypothetical protein
MENAAAGPAGHRRESQLGRCLVAAALVCGTAPLWAQDAAQAPQDMVLAEARTEPLRIELNSSNLPRLDGQEAGFQGPRVDLSVRPGGRSDGLGVGVGMSNFTPRAGLPPGGLAAPRAAMDVGLHYRHMLPSQGQIDVAAWRRMAPQQDAYSMVQMSDPVYGARVEMRLKPANPTGFNFDSGLIGMQLQGGAKISIKRKNGGPMIYYRNTF